MLMLRVKDYPVCIGWRYCINIQANNAHLGNVALHNK